MSKEIVIYYATNRAHKGNNRWNPDSYTTKPSSDGIENLRFGKAFIGYDEGMVSGLLGEKLEDIGQGNGEDLQEYFTECCEKSSRFEAFAETLKRSESDQLVDEKAFGSIAMFYELRDKMLGSATDLVVLIHGYNVSWDAAVGTACALQTMLNNKRDSSNDKEVIVLLFSWPSDGSMAPWAYKNDRRDAQGSGGAFGRGLLKLRDFFNLCAQKKEKLCGNDIHLVAHSMGNYVLENALCKMIEYSGGKLPRLFSNIFLCSADIDNDALEEGKPLGRLHEMARVISVYHNEGDSALFFSDKTKGNPDRLGQSGAARPAQLPSKIHQIDCTQIVHGVVEHSYYLAGNINKDLRQTIDGVSQYGSTRRRVQIGGLNNVWEILGS